VEGAVPEKERAPTYILGKQGGDLEVFVGEKKQAKNLLTNADANLVEIVRGTPPDILLPFPNEKWWVLLEGLLTP
jgi:hypothetical protein